MKYRSSSQAFKFEIRIVLRLLKLTKEEGEVIIEKLAKATGEGTPKIKEFINYMEFCDLLKEKKVTRFGEKVLQLEDSPRIIEQLLYYKLSRGSKNGGHYYFSILTNYVLYYIAFFLNNFEVASEIINKACNIEVDNKYTRDSESQKKKNFRQALNGGLADKYTGFGKMGMVVEKSGQYEVTGFIPDRLITAYVLYDNWPKDRTAIKRDDLYTMPYFPARLFFMVPRLFEEQINHLVDERILYYEREGGLNQITLAPNLSPDKILDRIIENA